MTSHLKILQDKSTSRIPISNKRFFSRSHPAFTIVELLIVVIVIAILATITMVAYNGITNNAKESALKSDLRNASTKIQLAQVETGSFLADDSSLPKANGITYQYRTNNTNKTFCITATTTQLPNKSFYTDQDGSIKEGTCPGDISNIAGTMQSFTSQQCTALPIFTGSNQNAVIGLTDSRGGITRAYQVAKLADNKCWMLSNLKLGSTTQTITLTPQDSNVATNFILPQVRTTGSTDSSTNPGNGYDTPYAYGPVTGDTGSGATNYGYLYNWSAATAGATRTSNGAGSGNAANSICPANWRLPSGGTWNSTTNELSILNARMAGLTGVTDAGYTSTNFYGATFHPNWQNAGPFKGVFSGYWWGSFEDQGSYAYLWSSTARASNANSAHYVYFSSGLVAPDDYDNRDSGFGVRCLLN